MPQSATLGKDSSPNLNPISSSFQIGEMHESMKAAGKERKASCLHWFAMYITVVTPPRHRPCQEPKETFPSLSWRNLLLTSPPRYPHLLNGFSCHSGIHSNGSDLKSLLRSDLFPPCTNYLTRKRGMKLWPRFWRILLVWRCCYWTERKMSEGAHSYCWEFTVNTIGQAQWMIAPVPLIGEPDFSLLSFFLFWLRAVVQYGISIIQCVGFSRVRNLRC